MDGLLFQFGYCNTRDSNLSVNSSNDSLEDSGVVWAPDFKSALQCSGKTLLAAVNAENMEMLLHTRAIWIWSGFRLLTELSETEGAGVDMLLTVGPFGSTLAAGVYGEGLYVVKFLVEEGGTDVDLQLFRQYPSALRAALAGRAANVG
ncbi:hypothetical protein DL96DRAFT_1565120 [Flagelloscypha sp. PMI_526]|nr:hypothetical protein DL96DRAFT_1565120 [Flagelloscypha sp. PMI_526]